MTHTTTWCLLTAALWAWQEPAPPMPATDKLTTPAEIQLAVENLGHDRIAVRDQASRQLWEAGRSAEAALKVAATNTDAEVRLRAQSILDRFRYGVFADTPPEVVELIHQFRNGQADRRAAILQQLAERRQYATVFLLIDAETDPGQRAALLERFQQDSNGVIGQLIRQGKLVEAERILELSVGQDAGMLALASHFLVTGRLDARVEQARRELAARPNPAAARLLVYLLRAKGDLAGALDAARSADDKTLDRALLLELGRWSELAILQRDTGPKLPVPLGVNAPSSTAAVERIEFLGYDLAATTRAKLDDDARRLVADLKQFATDQKETPILQWHAAEALLISDRAAEGIEMLKTAQPLSAFDLLSYQHRYREAFDFVGLKPERAIDADWLDNLPVMTTSATTQKYQRFRLALSVARVLHLLGRKQQAAAVVNVLERYAQDAASRERGTGGRTELLLQLAQLELRIGLHEPAFAHAEQAAGEADSHSQVLRALFVSRVEEASAWYQLVRKAEPQLALVKILPRIHRLMVSPAPVDATDEELTRWLQPALDHAATIEPPDQRALFVESLATSFTARNALDAARKLLEFSANTRASSAVRLGDLDAEQKKWKEAATWYAKAVELDPQQILAAYLAGVAREKSGDAETGRKLQLQARMMSFNSRARHSLAQQVHHRGHLEEAERLLETAMRTGPFEHWETNDAARLLGEVLSERDPAAAAQLWDRHMLADLRAVYNFLDVESYVRFPFLIHKERAKSAVAAGNFDAAREECRSAWLSSPNDVRLAEDIVPRLDKALRRDEADPLFDQTFASLSAIIEEYPDSAFHRNNLAWVAARCHRRLDEALAHAQHAVKLAPDTPSYLDTLAEVHFHRGNRDEAVRLAQQALKISPRYKTFQEQLARFQSESLPK